MDYKAWDEESEEIKKIRKSEAKTRLPYQELVKICLRKNGEDGMYKFEGYEIAVPHFYCLEYYEGGKK